MYSIVSRGLAALLAVLLLIAPAPARAGDAPFSAIIVTPDLPGSVRDPGCVVVDPLGPVVVVDTGNDRVRVLAPDGSLLSSIGTPGSGAGQLSAPQSASIGPDGLLYVADTGNGRVQVFTLAGEHVRVLGSAGTLTLPWGVAVDAALNVYVSEAPLHRVRVLSPTGQTVRTIGSYGNGAGNLDNPRAVAIDTLGRLFVADTANRRVSAFTASTGVFLGEWGYATVSGVTSSRYVSPTGVTMAPSGEVIVTDMGALKVERCPATPRASGLSLPANQTWSSSIAGGELGQFRGVRGAALASNGMLYVADSGNHRVQRWTSASLWIAPWSADGSGPAFMSEPRAICAAPDGRVLVADTGGHRVLVYDAEGGYLFDFGGFGTGAAQLSGPRGVAMTAGGEVLVSDTGNKRIQRFSAQGEHLGSFGTPVLSSPRGIAVGEDGTVFVADAGTHRIERFSAVGAHLGAFGSPGSGAGNFHDPTGVAVGPRNVLWVADTGNHRVQKLDGATGAFRLEMGRFGTAAGEFAEPTGVAALSDGTVVVTDSGNDRLQRFDGAGNLLGVIGAPGAIAGRFNRPADVAHFGARLWVVERAGKRIQAFVSDGNPPVTVISGVPSEPTSQNVTFALSASDEPAGIADTYYRIGDGFRVRYLEPVTVTEEGTTSVGYFSHDRAGNVEPERIVQVVIDRTPPQGAVVLAGGASIVGTTSVAVRSDVTGAHRMRLSVAGSTGAWMPFSQLASVSLPAEEGSYEVVAEYADLAGNLMTATASVKLQLSAPVIDRVFSPSHPDGELVRRATTAHFEWGTAEDGSAATGYSWVLDRNPDTVPDESVDGEQASATFSRLAGGTWYFHVRAVDVTGRWGETVHVPIRLTAPTFLGRPFVLVQQQGKEKYATVRVAGRVGPARTDGSVRIRAQRFESGKWVTRSDSTAAVMSDSRYSGTLRLPEGRWRIVVLSDYDGVNERGTSPWSQEVLVRRR